MAKRTIQQQLAKRHDCRYGLRGLQCHLAGDEAPYRILESEWGENCLQLRIVPAAQWDAYQAASRPSYFVSAEGLTARSPSFAPPPWTTGRNRKVSA